MGAVNEPVRSIKDIDELANELADKLIKILEDQIAFRQSEQFKNFMERRKKLIEDRKNGL